MPRRLHVFLFAAAAALSVASPSLAADPAAEEPTLEQARDAFLKGNELMESEEWAAAEERFSYATGARNTPGLHYYIGYCREKRGLLIEALASYREAERLLESGSATDVAEILPLAVQRVMNDMPQVHLHDVPAGATLEVDGQKRHLSAQFSLNPGRHTLVISKPGYTRFSETLTLKPGVLGRINVVMAPVKEGQPEDVDPWAGHEEPESGVVKKVVFWSGVGVGTIGLGVGITGTIVHASAKSELNDLNEAFEGPNSACSDPDTEFEVFCDDFARVADKRDLGGTLMVGGYIGAGVGAVTAVAAHFLWPDTAVKVDVETTRRGGLLQVSGHW